MTEYVNSIVNLDTVGLSPAYSSVIALNDGRLMWVWGSGRGEPVDPVNANFSHDEGATWSEPVQLMLATGEPLRAVMDSNLMRLKSGALGLVMRSMAVRGDYETDYHAALIITKSDDEGETWSAPVAINPPGTSAVITNERATVLRDGRIIVPYYTGLGPKPTGDAKKVYRYSHEFSNAERGSLSYSSAYYSDDEGQTWRRSTNEVFVTLERGLKGSFTMGESTVIELNDGRVLKLGRTNLGRFFQSMSDDRGETWNEAEPTDLACCASPCNISRIPSTGDLLVIWNQISKWETMTGLYRHRLSCAISSDEGKTWRNHRNLESLDDTTYIEPGPMEVDIIGKFHQPVDRDRYHRAPGPLRCNQPTCTYIGDKVVITYGYCVFGDKSVITDTYGIPFDDLMKQLGIAPYDRANKVRVMSTDWFYE
jgi:hypothetical protein